MELLEHHYINKGQERCRVCSRLLVAPDKKPKYSNQCTEFTLLTTSTHALKFCYQCKQVMRVALIAEMRVLVAGILMAEIFLEGWEGGGGPE